MPDIISGSAWDLIKFVGIFLAFKIGIKLFKAIGPSIKLFGYKLWK